MTKEECRNNYIDYLLFQMSRDNSFAHYIDYKIGKILYFFLDHSFEIQIKKEFVEDISKMINYKKTNSFIIAIKKRIEIYLNDKRSGNI